MTQLEYSILQSHYPQNARIILDRDSVGGIPAGTVGRIVSINKELGVILVEFDNGMRSSLIYESDYYHRINRYMVYGL